MSESPKEIEKKVTEDIRNKPFLTEFIKKVLRAIPLGLKIIDDIFMEAEKEKKELADFVELLKKENADYDFTGSLAKMKKELVAIEWYKKTAKELSELVKSAGKLLINNIEKPLNPPGMEFWDPKEVLKSTIILTLPMIRDGYTKLRELSIKSKEKLDNIYAEKASIMKQLGGEELAENPMVHSLELARVAGRRSRVGRLSAIRESLSEPVESSSVLEGGSGGAAAAGPPILPALQQHQERRALAEGQPSHPKPSLSVERLD